MLFYESDPGLVSIGEASSIGQPLYRWVRLVGADHRTASLQLLEQYCRLDQGGRAGGVLEALVRSRGQGDATQQVAVLVNHDHDHPTITLLPVRWQTMLYSILYIKELHTN